MDAILAQTSPQPLLSSAHALQRLLDVFICVLPKTSLAPAQILLLVTQPAASSRFGAGLPTSSAPPRGLVLLLTGVICAPGIDVVCQPIKIFEGNVYFLERITPAAWKLF